MKKNFGLLFGFLLIAFTAFAQENDFEPHGKPVLRIFSNYHATLEGGETAQAFELQRVYLGYQHNFSKNLSGQAVLDVGDPGVGGLQMTAYVKNAYLKYKTGNFSTNFGLISTTQFKVQESAWGYRYIEKSFQDAYKFNSSADLGISASYKIGDIISADVIVANGEGYKKIEADSTFRTGFGLTLTPINGLTVRGYYDFSTNEVTQSSLAAFIGYEIGFISIGAEYMKMSNYKFTSNQELNGLSFYSTAKLGDKLKVFGRFDNLSSNVLAGETEAWQLSKDGQLYIAGLEFSPVKGVKLAPNFQGWNPADGSESFISTFILNCEVKF